MGQTLSEPVLEKTSESGGDERLVYGLSSMQGWRISMEDSHAAILDLQNSDKPHEPKAVGDRFSFFGVYDGHGGDKVALFSGQNVHKILAKQAAFESGNFEQALKDGFLATDRAILQDSRYEDEVSGCTASTALLTNSKIYVANAGDSRTVLGVKGKAKPLSFDHKPQNEGEKARITAAGGFVDFGRVNGNLALSRAIGDFEFKKNAKLPPEQQIVTAYPDVVVHEISDDDEFLVIACDGIWDCLSSQNVIEFVRRGIAAKQELHVVCENMMNNCLSSGSDTGGVGCDNMTMLVVGLLREKTKDEWYDMVAKRVADGDGPCAPPEYADLKFPGNKRAHANDLGNNEGESNGIIRTTRSRIIGMGDGSEPNDPDADAFEQADEEAFMKDLIKETKIVDVEMADILARPSVPSAPSRKAVTETTKESDTKEAKKAEEVNKEKEDASA